MHKTDTMIIPRIAKITVMLSCTCFLFSSALFAQDTSKHLKPAIHLITVSLPITQSHFYTKDVSRVFNQGFKLYPNVTLQYDYISNNLLTASFVLSEENHSAISTRFLDYNLHFITTELLTGFNLLRVEDDSSSAAVIARSTIGPYISYLFYAEEGGYEIDHSNLNKWPIGITLSFSLIVFPSNIHRKTLYNIDLKIHHSFSKILDFKIDAYSLSFLSLKLFASI